MKNKLLVSLLVAAGVVSAHQASASEMIFRKPIQQLKPITGVPTASFSKGSLSFGTVTAGTVSRQTVTLTNTGDVVIPSVNPTFKPSAGPFSIDSTTCNGSLTQGSSCTLTIAASPTADVQLIDGYYSLGVENATVALSGNTFVPAPNSALTANGSVVGTLGFGAQAVGTTSTAQAVAFQNSGNIPFTVSSIATVGDFTATQGCGTLPFTLAPGDTCNINVAFKPTKAGAVTADSALVVTSSIGTKSVSLTGTGMQALVGTSTSALSFGNQNANTSSAAQSVSVTNDGNMTLTGVTITPPTGYTLSGSSCGGTIAIGGSCSFNVVFAPTASGAYNGNITITSNAAAKSIAVSGTGVTPLALTMSAGSLPTATRGTAYSFDFKSLFSMTGDGQPSPGSITWSTVGTAPTGLSLGTDGVMSGTPTVIGSSSFDVVATYTDKKGQQTYTIVVNGQPLDVIKIAAGHQFSCALTSGGTVKCWGANGYGQLGNGGFVDKYVPTAVSNLGSGVVDLATGTFNACAIYNTGAVKCWGLNNVGQLGIGSAGGAYSTPVTSLVTDVASLTGGDGHMCALLKTGAVQCWGQNNYGQVGDGSTTQRNSPVTITSLGTVKSIATLNMFTCAVTTGGAAKCWGSNTNGGIGDGSGLNQSSPVQVYGLTTGVRSITTSSNGACALMDSGAVNCWGTLIGVSSFMPKVMTGLSSGVSMLKGAWEHMCALDNGGLKCWGNNSVGNIGDGTTGNSRPNPTAVSTLTSGVLTFNTAGYHACASLTTGVTKCWGYNNYGQLGNGNTTSQYTPVVLSM